MKRSRLSALCMVLATVVFYFAIAPAASQEVGLIPLNTQDVAKGYRAEALKLKTVVNDKGEKIGRIDDFIFGQDQNVFAVLSVGDIGLDDHLVAVPFRSLKLDDPLGNIVLSGACRAALAKLPVFLYHQ